MYKLIILLLLLLNSCATNKDILETNVMEIKFGNGGGFTGEIISYSLNEYGVIKQKSSEIKKINDKETLEFFKEANKLTDYKFNEPENMYSFIEIKTKNKTNRIVWHLGSNNIDSRVIELYNSLISKTN